MRSTTPAAISSQNVNASIRGNAIRRHPIISGTSQLANGPRMTEVIIPIIIVPCRPTSVRYWLGPNAWLLGFSSSVRMNIALSPPMKKKKPIPTMYWSPTTLWSVHRRK